MWKCEHCGAEISHPETVLDREYHPEVDTHQWEERMVYICPYCGSDELTEGDECEYCGAFADKGWRFCDRCKDIVEDMVAQMPMERSVAIRCMEEWILEQG